MSFCCCEKQVSCGSEPGEGYPRWSSDEDHPRLLVPSTIMEYHAPRQGSCIVPLPASCRYDGR